MEGEVIHYTPHGCGGTTVRIGWLANNNDWAIDCSRGQLQVPDYTHLLASEEQNSIHWVWLRACLYAPEFESRR